MSSSSTVKWLFVAILCIFFTRPPSCHCPATWRDPSTPSRLLATKAPYPPMPASSPLPTLPPFTRLPVPNYIKPLNLRHSAARSLAPVSLVRCQVYYMRTEGLTLSRAVSRCIEHRDRAVAGGRIVGSRILLPPPPTPAAPTGNSPTRTAPSAPRPYTRQEGISLVDRPRYGAGVVLRKDVIRAVRDSRAVVFGNWLWKSAAPRWRKLVRSVRVYCGRLKWFVRISVEEEELRNGNLLILLWIGSWLVSDAHDEESEAGMEPTNVAETPQPARLMIEWYSVGERGTYSCVGLHSALCAFIREDVLASVTLSTLSLSAELVLPRTRLLIEWRPTTQTDQNQSPLVPASRRPRRAVRPGHGVYQPPVMQDGLTQERCVARSEARRQVLEQVEREAQEPVHVPEVVVEAHADEHRRKKRRGGVKVRARRAVRKEHLAREVPGDM